MRPFFRFMELVMYYLSFTDMYTYKVPGLQLRADALKAANMSSPECQECLAMLQALPSHRFSSAVADIVADVTDDLQQKAGDTP